MGNQFGPQAFAGAALRPIRPMRQLAAFLRLIRPDGGERLPAGPEETRRTKVAHGADFLWVAGRNAPAPRLLSTAGPAVC